MNISYNWLKEYIDLQLSPQQLIDKMTFAGIEIEAVEELGKELRQFQVAEIIEKKPHPNADQLSICLVNTGQEEIQVVCGAPNCKSGQKVVLAPVGSKIGDLEIKKVKLRGEESYGMLCSEKELGISDNHEGIMVLPDNSEVGKDLATQLGLNDVRYEAEITPNRPDLLGMIGIARDLSALLNRKLQLPVAEISEDKTPIETLLSLENTEPKLCQRYLARVIKGVKIAPAPAWLQNRLRSVGLRPINNVVDITNFVMMEYGHPLHAFDYDKIVGKKIIVRRAKQGEKFTALDEETYNLNSSDLVIADSEKPMALAGIIGGTNSHITAETTNIVLEAANFHYIGIRRSSSHHKIFTDSSYRFERGMSSVTNEFISKRAASFILEIAGGELAKGALDSYPNPLPLNIVKLRPSRVHKLLTIEISSEQIKQYLEALGLKQVDSNEEELAFQIPSFRQDLTREIDLIEEIIRLHGYNNVQTFQKPQNITDTHRFYARRRVQDAAVNNGFSEIINWSFGDPDDLDKLQLAPEDPRRKTVKIKNPLGPSFSIMRSSLIPQLLKTALYNIHHGQEDLKLFELNKVFSVRRGQKLANEELQFSGLMCGLAQPNIWHTKTRQVDFYDAKGVAEDILQILHITNVSWLPSEEPFYQPGQAAKIAYKKLIIGNVGKMDAKIAATFNLEKPLYLIDINLEKILREIKTKLPQFQPIPKFPTVQRDISLLIPAKYNWSKVKKAIFQINPKIIKNINIFDEYKGKNVEKGWRSISFSLQLSSSTKTLTDDYINNLIQKIIDTLKNRFSIQMR
ncbi:MAG: phenylalanyl-tRNA synthetase beta chain [Candidatus Cloacimonadota bacterium]|jgi:phenylalanyl-tRNA synthetase beta chain|nr:phenylalanyl-tRNA synthetase beta chain [Candidatus Cloacimonadota bacterium]